MSKDSDAVVKYIGSLGLEALYVEETGTYAFAPPPAWVREAGGTLDVVLGMMACTVYTKDAEYACRMARYMRETRDQLINPIKE